MRGRWVAKETFPTPKTKKSRIFLANPPSGWLPLKENCMKKRIALILTTFIAVGSIAFGDIQSPSGHHNNWSRKLSRACANILYGATEPFTVWQRTNRSEGANAAATDFFIEGTKRSLVRLGYGCYEFLTFPMPTWKMTYRAPYYRKEQIDPWWGYTEFSPELGFQSEATYNRTQGW